MNGSMDCSSISADAEALLLAGINLSKNPHDAGDSAVSPRESLAYLFSATSQ